MRLATVLIITACLVAILGGCSNPEADARKLFMAGKYNDVLTRFYSTTYGDSAKSKLAEDLFKAQRYEEVLIYYPMCGEWFSKSNEALAARLYGEQKYQEILDSYSQTPYADSARNVLSRKLYEAGKYQEVLYSYSQTSYADSARGVLSQRLYEARKYEDVLNTYPNSAAAKEVDKRHPEVRRRMESEQIMREAVAAVAQRREQEERRQACRNHPSNCLKIGMRDFEVRSLIGPPDDINRTVFSVMGEQQVHEQWVYEHGVYVYIENHGLTSWQE